MFGRRFVDLTNRGTLERPARSVSFSQHLLAPPEGMGGVGRLRAGLGTAARQARSLAGHQLGTVDRRWHVCLGKKGGPEVGNTKKGKGTKVMLLVDGEGLPLGVHLASANQAEVNLVEDLLDFSTTDRRPKRLLYDRAADSDPLRARLKRRRIELICPHRKNRTKPPTQDGRSLRRYRQRYKVERTISWLFNYRRLVVRYERIDHLFLGFVQLACMMTVLKKLLTK
jgi:transposase